MSTQEGGDLDVEKEMHKESWVIYGWRVYIEREREREDSSVAIADGGRKRKIKKKKIRGER
jgi:hypothetical protein